MTVPFQRDNGSRKTKMDRCLLLLPTLPTGFGRQLGRSSAVSAHDPMVTGRTWTEAGTSRPVDAEHGHAVGEPGHQPLNEAWGTPSLIILCSSRVRHTRSYAVLYGKVTIVRLRSGDWNPSLINRESRRNYRLLSDLCRKSPARGWEFGFSQATMTDGSPSCVQEAGQW